MLTNLKVWAKSKVVFIITQRPSTIRDADRIVFLKTGRVTETGTHDELLALGGDYHRFVSLDASNEESDV